MGIVGASFRAPPQSQRPYSVSPTRSSNRTCGSPASGSRTRFIPKACTSTKHTRGVDETESLVQVPSGVSTFPATPHLVLVHEPTTNPTLKEPLQLRVRLPESTVAEVVQPTAHHAVDVSDQLRLILPRHVTTNHPSEHRRLHTSLPATGHPQRLTVQVFSWTSSLVEDFVQQKITVLCASPATFHALSPCVIDTFSVSYDASSRRLHGNQDLRPEVLEATCEVFDAPRRFRSLSECVVRTRLPGASTATSQLVPEARRRIHTKAR